MPRNVTVTFDDGSTHVYQNVPDEATPDQVTARASQEFGKGITALDGGRQAAPPQKHYSLENNILGAVAEPVTTMVTGGIGMAAGGIAGLVQGAKNLVSPGMDAANRVEQVQKALTYEPRTSYGKVTTEAAGNVLGWPLRKIAQGADKAGQATSDAFDSPLAGAAMNTTIQALPAILTRGKVGRGRVNASPVGAAVEGAEIAPRPPVAAQAERPAGLGKVSEPPSVDQLSEQATAAYKAVDEAGITLSGDSLKGLKSRIAAEMKTGGVDATLHPDTSAALKRVLSTNGDISLAEMETLRKIASDAEGSVKPADSRLASKITDQIDNFVEHLNDADVTAGDPAKAAMLKEARALYTRKMKAEQIGELFRRAEIKAGANYTQSGLENSLRQEFKSLALNKNRLRRFTSEEQAAITKVAKGAPLENFLRYVGKAAMRGPVSGSAGMGAVAMLGPIGVALPIAGEVGRFAATRMTLNNAKSAEALMRRGPTKTPTQKLAEQYAGAQ